MSVEAGAANYSAKPFPLSSGAHKEEGASPLAANAEILLHRAESTLEEFFPESLKGGSISALRSKDFINLLRHLGQFIPVNPKAALRVEMDLAYELVRITLGRSEIRPPKDDRRFRHSIWGTNPYYRRVMQSYLAWCGSLYKLLEASNIEPHNKERAAFLIMQMTQALAPTNRLTGNPNFLKKAVRTRGRSVAQGARNFIDDLLHNGAMPRHVNQRAYQVGETLATSKGAVVYRTPVFELIQYKPSTQTVQHRPVLFVPPQINKFYLVDLAPNKSFVEYLVNHGMQFFTISWRNPTRTQGNWGLDTYLSAIHEAIDVVRDISDSDDVHMIGACVAGMISSILLSHLKTRGQEHKVASLTLLVTMLDSDIRSIWNLFTTPSIIRRIAARSRRKGIIEGHMLARTFSWLQPKELIWLYFANNYLMGNQPPAFDFLYWNNDSTRLPGCFHADLMTLHQYNPLIKPNGMRVLNSEIDLGKVDCDCFLMAGLSDHIVPWQACYRNTQILGGNIEFVLSSSGHIQSVVNPPNKAKISFYTNSDYAAGPEEWLEQAEQHKGSWWPYWLEWAGKRSGGSKPAPQWLGNARHRPGRPAPGRYVHQR